MKKQHIPGLSMAIIRNNALIYGQGYGYANLEHKVPVKLETMFQSGSMGKQFTAMAIMILVERGELDLDTSISEYIDDTPKRWRKMTIRHLLTHTAGTGDYPSDFDYREDKTEEDMLELIKETPLEFEPGDQYSYSNFGYVLLGILIGQVTGEFYGDFLSREVFAPLGMKTARVISESDIVSNRASGYIFEDGKIKHQEWVAPSMNTSADGALYLNIHDMVQWELGLNTNRLLKNRQSFKEMWTPVTLNDDSTYPYGFGWSLGRAMNGMQIVYHDGTWQGFETFIIRVLEAKVAVVVFANLCDPDLEAIATHVLAIYDSQLALTSEEEE